ncbi:hypothetical protein [Vibrio maerlii]|uniref:hypothetical protein n=1 Tax=Vibrio maerlii TaxID=2231648 RepID=UPI000E3D1D6A|nr:hypothetical protein [Vibrio maerlii]
MNKKNVPYLYAALWALLLSVYGGARFANAETQPCIDAFQHEYHEQVAVTLAEFDETSPDHYTVDNVLFQGNDGSYHRKDGMTCVITNGHAELD